MIKLLTRKYAGGIYDDIELILVVRNQEESEININIIIDGYG